MIFVTYLIYTLLYEAFFLGGTAYIVFWLGHSGWWFLLAVMFSAGQYGPEQWKSIADGVKGGKDV